MSRKPIIYIWDPIKYLQDTQQIYPGHLTNIYRIHIKYHKETYEIYTLNL